jgi:hypothetical protein
LISLTANVGLGTMTISRQAMKLKELLRRNRKKSRMMSSWNFKIGFKYPVLDQLNVALF